jgi:hypothetical protein
MNPIGSNDPNLIMLDRVAQHLGADLCENMVLLAVLQPVC